MGVLSMWKKRGHGESDHSGQAQTKEGGTRILERRDRAEIARAIVLLERIAYQTSGLALTFEQYLDMVKTNATQSAS